MHRMLTSKCKQNESCQNYQNIGFRGNLNLEKGAELPLTVDLYFVYNTYHDNFDAGRMHPV